MGAGIDGTGPESILRILNLSYHSTLPTSIHYSAFLNVDILIPWSSRDDFAPSSP